jgi:hypothetical protein
MNSTIHFPAQCALIFVVAQLYPERSRGNAAPQLEVTCK